jgi:hypothetical protein
VQELRVLSLQNFSDGAHFARRNLPRLVANLSKPKATQKMERGLLDEMDLIEGKRFGVLAFLGDYNRLKLLESGNLPVDVQHLRLEKCRTIKCNNRP